MIPGPGTIRGLRQLCTDAGRVCIVAIDQRQSLRSMLRTAGVEPNGEALRQFKRDVARALGDICPALLVDPEYGLPAVAADPQVPARLSLVVSVEESGSVPWGGGRRSLHLPGWGAQQARNAGASAAKLLLYLRSDHEATLEPGIALAEGVRRSCLGADLPFVLELVPFALEGEPEADYRRAFGQHVVSGARIGAELSPDLLKLPWPGPLGEEAPEPKALEKLGELAVPWALLSAGARFERFLSRVARALDEGGACGVIAGRALWQDAVGHSDTGMALRAGARERLLRLLDVIGERGRALPIPAVALDETWFRKVDAT